MADREPRPRLPNRRRDYPEPTYTPPRRRWEDMGPWERVLKSTQTVVPVLLLFQTAMIAIGYRIERPNDRLMTLDVGINTLKARRDSDHAEFLVLLNRTNALAKYRCLHLDAETAYQLGLDCNVLLPGYHMPDHPVPPPTEDGVLPFKRTPTLGVSPAPAKRTPQRPTRLPAQTAGFLAAPRVRLPEWNP